MAQLYLGFDPSDSPDPIPPPDDTETKRCHCCCRDLPRSEFYRLTRSRDGLQPRCKTCDKGKVPSTRPKSPNAGRSIESPTKWCSGCEKELPRSEFEKRERSRDGLQARCRVCNREAVKKHQQADPQANADYHREWRKKNPGNVVDTRRKHYRANREKSIRRVAEYRKLHAEAVREYSRAYLKATGKGREYCQNRRAAKQRVTRIKFTTAQLQAKVQYWGEKCWMCGGPFEAIDHVKPLTKGGPHCLANIRPACKSCNSKKRNKWPFRPEPT